jgi:hypothetical protein
VDAEIVHYDLSDQLSPELDKYLGPIERPL